MTVAPGDMLVVLVIGPGLGGVGKTWAAEVIHCLLQAAGVRTYVVDTDAAGYSLRDRLGGVDQRLPWTRLGPDAAPGLLAEARRSGAGWVIVDLGAGAASSEGASDFLAALLIEARATGARTVSAAVVSPNKPAADRNATAFLRNYAELAEAFIIENDRDGSGEFRAYEGMEGTRVRLPHVMPGLMFARSAHPDPEARIGAGGKLVVHGEPLLPRLENAPRDLDKAMRLLAKAVLGATQGQGMRSLLGFNVTAVEKRLKAAAAGAPPHFLARTTLEQVSDHALTLDANLLDAKWTLERVNPMAADAVILAAARRYLTALEARGRGRSA